MCLFVCLMATYSFLTIWFLDGFEFLILNDIDEHLVLHSFLNFKYLLWPESNFIPVEKQLDSDTRYLMPEIILRVKKSFKFLEIKFNMFLFSIVTFSDVFMSILFYKILVWLTWKLKGRNYPFLLRSIYNISFTQSILECNFFFVGRE